MIRGIFCHDLPIYKDKNGIYCSTTLTDELFCRYLSVVDELIVATRVYRIDQTYEEAHQEKITLKNVHFVDFPNINTPRGFFEVMPKVRKKLYELISTADLVFVRGGTIALLSINAARKMKKAYLFECAGGSFINYWNYSFIGKIVAPYMEYRERKDAKTASFVLYVTKEYLQKKYPTKGKRCAVSDVLLKKMDDEVLDRRLEKIRTNKKPFVVIGTTGYISSKNKGQQFVIKAMYMLKDNFDIRYELVGGGDPTYLKSIVRKYRLEDKVIFKGQLSHEEVLEWLDGIDLYIQPSIHEGLPRALVEALSRACPAIGARTGGIPELLGGEMVFKRGNTNALAAKLSEALLGDLGRQAKKNFDKAKEYEADKLNRKRQMFFEEFKRYVIQGDIG